MNAQAWTNQHIDRTGPWDREPDKVQWTDVDTGLPCLAVRNEKGNWCGYVGLSAGHPLHGKPLDEAPDLVVHGGLTFADACGPGPIEGSICHVPAPGEAASPRLYRTLEYVQAQCAQLAKQL